MKAEVHSGQTSASVSLNVLISAKFSSGAIYEIFSNATGGSLLLTIVFSAKLAWLNSAKSGKSIKSPQGFRFPFPPNPLIRR